MVRIYDSQLTNNILVERSNRGRYHGIRQPVALIFFLLTLVQVLIVKCSKLFVVLMQQVFPQRQSFMSLEVLLSHIQDFYDRVDILISLSQLKQLVLSLLFLEIRVVLYLLLESGVVSQESRFQHFYRVHILKAFPQFILNRHQLLLGILHILHLSSDIFENDPIIGIAEHLL